MKKYLLSIIVFFAFTPAFAQDMQDTLVFDLSQQTQGSGYVQFPVYFLSDDVINAVDFSLRYNTNDLAFDSIIKLASYLNVTYNETHGADTTVYFTSYSLQTIVNDTPLVLVRFTPAAAICGEDLIAVTGLLNGNAVAVRIVDCVPNGMADAERNKISTSVYPNPVTENATVEFSLATKSSVTVSVYDITGKAVYEAEPAEYSSGLHKQSLDLSGIENGVYLVRINSGNKIQSTRISVIR